MADRLHFVSATERELRALDERLEAFNVQQTGIDDIRPLGIAIRDETGRLLGGLKGATSLGWLYVSVLWMEEDSRGHGLGTELLRRAESEAASRGCRAACLTSFSFQAPGFYLRQGYRIFGQLEDYPEGETMYFLTKLLDQDRAGDETSPLSA